MCYTTIIMPFDLRVKYHTRIQVFHILNGNAPEYLNDLELYRTFIMYNGCKLWNSLH